MPIYFVGMGPSLKYLSLKAIEALSKADLIIVDSYTSIVPDFSIEELRKAIGHRPVEITVVPREGLEGESICRLIEVAREKSIALLVPGDPFIATTHDAIRIEALKAGVRVEVIHGVSVYSMAPSSTGLQAYKFGKMITLVYPRGSMPCSIIDVIYDNYSRGLHTLLLFDLKLEEGLVMRINEAVDVLLTLEQHCRGTRNLEGMIGVLVAGLGTLDQFIKADLLEKLKDYSNAPLPQSLIIVAKLHPMELEALYYQCGLPKDLYDRLSNSMRKFIK
ncbi:MAG: diphthine synthase [Desulfurococcaceae archaeon]